VKSYRPLGIAMLVAFIGTCAASPFSCAYYGRHRAQSMCDETAIGSSIDDFRDRAKRKMDMVYDQPDQADHEQTFDDRPDSGNTTDSSKLFSGATRGEGDAGEGRERRVVSSEHGRVVTMATGFVFLRYFCDVEYVNGTITKKRVTSLD